MVEKPPPEKAPSNLIITGRYILQPEIFDILAKQERGAGGEIQLTDAMIELAQASSRSTASSSKASASTAAPRSASSPPTSPMRSSAPTSRPALRAEIKRHRGRGVRQRPMDWSCEVRFRITGCRIHGGDDAIDPNETLG